MAWSSSIHEVAWARPFLSCWHTPMSLPSALTTLLSPNVGSSQGHPPSWTHPSACRPPERASSGHAVGSRWLTTGKDSCVNPTPSLRPSPKHLIQLGRLMPNVKGQGTAVREVVRRPCLLFSQTGRQEEECRSWRCVSRQSVTECNLCSNQWPCHLPATVLATRPHHTARVPCCSATGLRAQSSPSTAGMLKSTGHRAGDLPSKMSCENSFARE